MAKQPAAANGRRDNLRKMLTIRRAEEKVMAFANSGQGLIRGHYHVYIGQEASGVGACNALGKGDYVFTTHRNHGHVIARGGELAGKDGGAVAVKVAKEQHDLRFDIPCVGPRTLEVCAASAASPSATSETSKEVPPISVVIT